MKTMTCKQLGGACDKPFHARSFDDITGVSRQHAMEMFQKKDAAHLQAMHDMQEQMEKPEVMNVWLASKQKEFEALPEE